MKKAVDDINLKLCRGSVLGIIGPNGAGKSTTINMLSGITDPTSGDIILFGERMNSASLLLKKRIGVIPEDPALFPNLKAGEQLYFTGRLYGVNKETLNKRIEELLDLFNFSDDKDTFIYKLSAGTKKKLAIICAIIHDPDLLLLDEPFENVDPLVSYTLQGIIKQLAGCGRTVILTSHNLILIEKLCTHIALIDKGKLIMMADTADIFKKIKKKGNQPGQAMLENMYLALVSPRRKEISLSWLKLNNG